MSDEQAGTRAEEPESNQKTKVFHTLFSNVGVGSVSDGSVPDALNILYNADIPTPSYESTGISPTIKTIEADGTSRYFDLQGRQLNGKPNKGLYIKDGKIFITD